MTSSVTAPLERQLGQMPGLNQMTSASSAGASVITLQFGLDLSLDVAEQEVQAAINAANNLLPSDLPIPPVYAKINPADAPILTLAVTSKTAVADRPRGYERDPAGAENLAAERRRPGQHQRRSPAGGAHPVQSAVARRLRPQHRRRPHHHRQLQRQYAERKFRRPGAGHDHQRQRPARERRPVRQHHHRLPQRRRRCGCPTSPTSSAAPRTASSAPGPTPRRRSSSTSSASPAPTSSRWSTASRRCCRRSRPRCRRRSTSRVLSDRTVTIRASVADVEFELALAVVLVVIVIFLFLRTLPGTIIPSLSVPLSLVGTLGVMYLLGFSLDNLSLMALTIATGFVVDDAIVMIENIARYVEDGMEPLEAALKRLAADRLHHHFADHLADRGADPAVVHGRRGRPAVPRIRHHARGHDRHLGGRLADAGADDVRQADPPSPRYRAHAASTCRPSALSTPSSRSTAGR